MLKIKIKAFGFCNKLNQAIKEQKTQQL